MGRYLCQLQIDKESGEPNAYYACRFVSCCDLLAVKVERHLHFMLIFNLFSMCGICRCFAWNIWTIT